MKMKQHQSKLETLRAFLDKEEVTMLHLDPRREGVVVPERFTSQNELRLNLSYYFPHADMQMSEESVEATLTFGGAPFRCRVPFDAIYALSLPKSGAAAIFTESLPPELYNEWARGLPLEEQEEESQRLRAQLTVVQGEQPAPSEAVATAPIPSVVPIIPAAAESETPKNRPTLTLIHGEKK